MDVPLCACDDDDVVCPCDDDGVVDACNGTFAANDDEEFPTDAQIARAQRAVYVPHRHNVALTRITTIAMIKHEEAEVEAEATRGSLADKDSFAEEGVDDDEEFSVDHQLALALRAVYARHRHDLTITEVAEAERVIKTTIALIKHEEAEAVAARGRRAEFDNSARDKIAVGVATAGLGVPRDSVRATATRAGSVIVEASVTVDGGSDSAAAFESSPSDPVKPLADESRFGPCAVSGVRIEKPAAAAAPTEAAPMESPSESAPPPSPGMTDIVISPLRAIDVVFHANDDNRHPEAEIEGRDGGLWDYNVADNDGERGDEEEAVRQDSCVAPCDSGGASAAAAIAAVGLQLLIQGRMIDDEFHAERSVYTSVLAHREESPSPPAPDDASATGCTYDDITKSAPPHLRCVVSPLSSLSSVLRCTAAPPPPTSRG